MVRIEIDQRTAGDMHRKRLVVDRPLTLDVKGCWIPAKTVQSRNFSIGGVPALCLEFWPARHVVEVAVFFRASGLTDNLRMRAIFRVQVKIDVPLETLTERHGKLACQQGTALSE
jgi:hypothetical protein